MNTILTEIDTEEAKKLRRLFKKWGYQNILCEKADALIKLAPYKDAPHIIIFSWKADNSNLRKLLAAISDIMHEQPVYLIALIDEADTRNIIQALDAGAHEVLAKPFDQEVFKRKLSIAASFIQNKQALLDSAAVLERYSRYIDKIASERAQQLIHSERLSSIGIMSAGIAHEMNTPVSYIYTSLETVKVYWDSIVNALNTDRLATDKTTLKALERIPNALERIEHGLERVTRLSTGLRDFSRASRGDRSLKSINTCITTALELAEYALKNNVTVIAELDEQLPELAIDSQKIEQVLINLFVNASHAMENSKDATLWVKSKKEEDNILITVDDNGPGIPADAVETIWKAFFTTKEEGKGTGLGLAISQGIIREHSGTIKVKNKKGGGASFSISLPISPS